MLRAAEIVKDRLKLPVWAGIVLISAVLLWLGARGLGAVFSSARQNATLPTSLTIVPNAPPDLHVGVTWDADAADTGRAMEPFTRLTIQSAYVQAWLQWNLSYLRGAPFGLATYFSGTALTNVEASVSQATADGNTVEQADTSHKLRLNLYSADGSIVGFTDESVITAQVITGADGVVRYAGETLSSYDVVMNVNRGVWTIQTWSRTSGKALEPGDLTAQPRAGFVGVDGPRLSLAGAPFAVRGVNYYPKASPWDRFWPNYDPVVIDSDFNVISGLGLNTVRIFIPYDQFGGPSPNALALDHLSDLLSRAATHDLKVIVTLFDFRVDYRLLSWPADDRHLEGLIPRFKNNPVIAAWDIKNEPDRDYGSGQSKVNAWLLHEASVIRGLDPNHLLTVGWSTGQAAVENPQVGDFTSFHFYAAVAQLPALLGDASAAGKPVVVSEFGLPTWNSWYFPLGHTEREQAAYYAGVLKALRDAGSAGFASWTLYDFADIPSILGTRWPWQSGPQANLGVIRADGSEKPAAALLRPNASLDVPPVSAAARILKPFWISFTIAAIGLVVGAAMIVRLARRRRHNRTGPIVP